MKYIWYQSMLESLRHHIEASHMDEDDALSELQYTEEYLHYEKFRNDESVTLTCPWSIHCSCKWEVSGDLTYHFKPLGLKQ